ncbi:MAG: glycerate kinase [Kineosporiaceae bacterium]
MRVLVAPDCFTGTLSAGEAAAAMAEGWRRTAPGDRVRELPLSDGGPGFVDALQSALGGERVPVVVEDPRGRPAPAEVLLVPSAAPGAPLTAYVESAQACGSHHLAGDGPSAGALDPAALSTVGVARLVAAGVAAGAGRVVVGLGGSATTDGGAGLLAGLGAQPADELRRGLPVAPVDLDLRPARAALAGVDLVVASDVDAPLLGPQGAVLGFGPQKGVPRADLAGLEARMSAWAESVEAARVSGAAGRPGAPCHRAPGAGAVGGLGLALLALGAARVPGAQEVADAVGLAEAARSSDLVVTGEGAFDWQSLRGKVVTAVARAAQAAAVPVVVVAGQVLVGRRELSSAGVDAAYAVAEDPSQVSAALADPRGTLAARVARVAATWSRPPVA